MISSFISNPLAKARRDYTIRSKNVTDLNKVLKLKHERMGKNMTKEFEYYTASDMAMHVGKWVAILDNKVISSGVSLKSVYADALKESGDREPLFVRVPEKDEKLIL